ncbi:MAG: TIGR03936 family radical SAM-associated protein [Christensenellales bacterium]
MKIVFQFEKNEALRYISHLDIQRLFQRCMRRAEIPVAYSKGYHPHPVLSFAMPLALGYTSGAEFGEVTLAQDMDIKTFLSKINRSLPPGMIVTAAKGVLEDSRALMPLVRASSYDAVFESGSRLQEEADALLAKSSLVKTKQGKHGARQLDIRPLVLSLAAQDNVLHMTLVTSGEQSLSPKLLLDEFTAVLCSVRRTALLGESRGRLVSLLDM